MAQTTTEKPTGSRSHFQSLSAGKLMGLRQITDPEGRFRVLAMDQSNSFKKALRAMHERAGHPAEPTYEEIRDAKLEMARILSPLASAVLLDVNYGARQVVNSFALPKNIGLIVRVEASKDAGTPSEYEPGWSVEQIKRMGASAVKLLVYLDTEDAANVKAQLGFAEQVAQECRRHDILLMTEELSFPRKGEEKTSPAYKARKVANIFKAAELLGPLTDILKLEFPGDIRNDPENRLKDNLAKLDAVAIRPWVLLSAGEKFDLFSKQAETAMAAGCSGYMAGRAIFNEYFEQPTPQARHAFLEKTGSERMRTLNAIVESKARGWMKRYELKASDLAAAVAPDWYAAGKIKKAAASSSGDY
ncbi:MAG TPA: tagatose 1,6-diphosphate aldolase [Elusimicrobiota bacterium]|nr:tagatose 1,6-diphosphate aldolase [Elusimicrobiota bacterium]